MAGEISLAQQAGQKLGNVFGNGLSFLKGLKAQPGAMTALRAYVPAAAAAQAVYDYGQWKGMQMDKEAADPNSALSQQMAEIRRNVANGYVPDDEGNWIDTKNGEVVDSNTLNRLNGLVSNQRAPVIQQNTDAATGLPTDTVAALMRASNEAAQASAPKTPELSDETSETTKVVSTTGPKPSGSGNKTSIKAKSTPVTTAQVNTAMEQYQPRSQLSTLDQLLPYILAGGLGLYAYNSFK